MTKWIPLLSGKAFEAFSAAEFKEHVRSLYHKRAARASAAKKKSDAVTWKLTPKGKLTLTVRRDPKWISPQERAQIEKWGLENKIPLSETFLTFKRLKVQVMNESEAREIEKRMVEIPW